MGRLAKAVENESSCYKVEKSEENMTRVLVVIMISFILLTSPNSVYFICDAFYPNSIYSEGEGASSSSNNGQHLLTAASNLMFALNYALSFYLYCFTCRSVLVLLVNNWHPGISVRPCARWQGPRSQGVPRPKKGLMSSRERCRG